MTDADSARPYHHGDLRTAAIAAAVAEIEEFGVSAASMRRIARRAGVSHAALAHHFTDKTGLFTAVATEGFRRMAAAIGPAASAELGFLAGGAQYVRFALENRGFYEVLFRPNLSHRDDPQLEQARSAAFDILYGSARRSLVSTRAPATVTDADVASLVIAGWSMSHGLATLQATNNLSDRPSGDILQGVTLLASLLEHNR
ncbi:TetR/AcrR family transcriptional regulator [Mycobacterium sp. TNTM28]|uniref:TetR/AcrR family transcriptional regulator n=1 Tax=[Mycobacterium] fortunisiensis TaxID=2600579 RepID=A0ABS6KLL8_9MYCO|nr:TetR/AcrR family transcriptional regulator [[Mycobacterium] fortunisiensis]MBU9764499.1 TetR/AcrR family transcriptional regulator [[Mycobacterium] fortunisiensis]